jgi:surface antigen
VSDELTPDPMAELLVNNDANQSVPAPLVPAAPQFSSRREMREALDAAKANAPKAEVAPSAGAPVYSKPKTKRVHLSMKDRALARKLSVAPSVAASAPRTRPSAGKPVARRKRQNPLKAAFVLLVISGFVGGIALPSVAATANAGSDQSFETTAGAAQGYKASATIIAPTTNRDEIGATSEAELKAEQINAATLASYPGKRAPGDDYPWRTAGYGLSPLNYYYRQCVDFVAWRLNRDAGVTSAPWKWTWSTLTPNGGDASQWKAAWEAHGWKTSATPVVGSVAWFVGNHVAYVNSIKGSNVVIEEYNGTSSRAYAMRTIPIDTVGRFLYPPPE